MKSKIHEYKKNNFSHMSKKIITILFILFFATTIVAQAPQKMSYQAVIRDAGGVLIANANVGIRISILQSSPVGTVVYAEIHSIMTNANGLALLEIGGGTLESGNFSTINWANGPYFIKTETDSSGGTNYTISGTSQLLSVPYAMFAANTNPPAFVFDEGGISYQTLRNAWVDYPGGLVIVPETGYYLLSFYGDAYNGNSYDLQATQDFDGTCLVRVIKVNTGGELLRMRAISQLSDNYADTNFPANYNSKVLKYVSMQPSLSKALFLNMGDQLKIQYNQTSVGTAPTTTWSIQPSGLSILKVD